jgi:hypothetical protein
MTFGTFSPFQHTAKVTNAAPPIPGAVFAVFSHDGFSIGWFIRGDSRFFRSLKVEDKDAKRSLITLLRPIRNWTAIKTRRLRPQERCTDSAELNRTVDGPYRTSPALPLASAERCVAISEPLDGWCTVWQTMAMSLRLLISWLLDFNGVN